MPTSHVSGTNIGGLLYLGLVIAVIFLPVLLNRGQGGSSPGDSDGDSGGGGGGGRRPPGPPPDRPFGGLPMPDATPARARLRDHRRLRDLLPTRQRRPVREPERAPSPQPIRR